MKRWIAICPRDQFTVLDTHDGVGVYDAAGIVSEAQAEAVIARIEHNLSYAFRPMDMSKRKYAKAYQLYGTYYAMLDHDDAAYLLARAIQFFAPGIPQVYYVGMLAGENDLTYEGADHRAINRKNYAAAELDEAFARPVVRALVDLMRFRNSHPAFAGDLTVCDTPDDCLELRRAHAGHTAVLRANVRTHAFTIEATEDGRMTRVLSMP